MDKNFSNWLWPSDNQRSFEDNSRNPRKIKDFDPEEGLWGLIAKFAAGIALVVCIRAVQIANEPNEFSIDENNTTIDENNTTEVIICCEAAELNSLKLDNVFNDLSYLKEKVEDLEDLERFIGRNEMKNESFVNESIGLD